MVTHKSPDACIPRSLVLRLLPQPLLILAMFLANAVYAGDMLPTETSIHASIRKSLPLLEAGARGSIAQRKQCFNCHNQGLPIMALTLAISRGFDVDHDHLREQVEFTAGFLTRNKDRYKRGEGQGGQIDTAGYALWALDYGNWKPDEMTSAVTDYLLTYQNDLDHHEPDGVRPPAEQSYFTSTYVALRGLNKFGTSEQQERIRDRFGKIKPWATATPAKDTEDRAFRLRLLALLGVSREEIHQAIADLRQTQRADGGWSQTEGMESDAYATGTALVALHEEGGLSPCDPAYRKGLAFLLSKQLEDGSWHVVSHARPFQSYFESGYPHGKDQFISIAAASWSTTAMILALPKREPAAKPEPATGME